MARSVSRIEMEFSAPKCVLDRTLMNKDTVKEMTDIGLSIFAPLCGKNRGAFVLDPPDGKTYGCIAFPKKFAQLAGVDNDSIVDSNSVVNQYKAGNLTEANVVDLIELYVESVYASSEGVKEDPFACDAGGLASLQCATDRPQFLLDDGPVRSVTLAGLFVPALWATGGKKLTLAEAKLFYKASDFQEMKTLGLNAVQIPVPVEAFAANGNGLVKQVLTRMLTLIEEAGLETIIVVVDDDKTDNHEAVTAAAAYCFENSVLALTLPSKTPTLLSAARGAAPTLALLVPVNAGGDLRELSSADHNVFGAVEMGHTTSVADVASSGSEDDRMKMFYHEAIACMARSPIEYASCYRDTPLFVASGFDLAIDNCIMEGSEGFLDYGQCGRFDETIESGWWERHRQSLAARQLTAFELGAGWSFSAWKLYNDDSEASLIDIPAKLFCLKNVVAAGLMPSLTDKESYKLSCLNPPLTDFVLGDATLSPTVGPPPDCGNGWWNFEKKQCDYWIPPPPTPTPSHAPSVGCPDCPECPVITTAMNTIPTTSYQTIALSAVTGGVVTLLLSALIKKIRGSDSGYSTLP